METGATPVLRCTSAPSPWFICDEPNSSSSPMRKFSAAINPATAPPEIRAPLAARSALDIDFTDLEEGDLVVHLHTASPLSRFEIDAVANSRHLSTAAFHHQLARNARHRIRPQNSGEEPPKLYVPVSEAHLVSNTSARAKPIRRSTTLGGTRWHKAKEQTEKAVRDIAAKCSASRPSRTQPGHPCKPDTQWQREFESAFIYEEPATRSPPSRHES